MLHKNGSSRAEPILAPDGVLASLRSEEINSEGHQAQAITMNIIEPNPLLREGLARLLEVSSYQVIGSTPSFAGLPSDPDRAPELILIGGDDVGFTIDMLERCRTTYPSARLVAFSDVRGEQLSQILAAGAHACVGRDVTLQALVMTLKLAMLGASIICRPLPHVDSNSVVPAIRSTVPNEVHARAGPADVSHRLSSREIAILECLVHGNSNKLIGRKFQIAESTVKVHVKAILRKLRAANRTQAAIWAMTHLARSAQENAPSAATEQSIAARVR